MDAEVLLREKLMAAIIDSGLTYKSAISALSYVQIVLKDKGSNLLDGANIQEVAAQERISR